MTDRQTWQETWMGVAAAVAGRSRCDGAHVGAVIVDAHQRPVSTGYNGPPSGFDTSAGPSCVSWCTRQQDRAYGPGHTLPGYGLACPTVHAEANALMFADRRDYAGGTLYVTSSVCADCAKLIANSGLAEVFMIVRQTDMHRDPRAVINFLESCKVQVWTQWEQQ